MGVTHQLTGDQVASTIAFALLVHTRPCPDYCWSAKIPPDHKGLLSGIANGGFPRGGFSNSWTCSVFFAWKSVIAREFLLQIDTSLAIATSGLRTNLLFEKPPFRKPPIRFSQYWCNKTCRMHQSILLKLNFGCITLKIASNNYIWKYFGQCNACAWRRPAENNGIAALQLHQKLVGEFIFVTLHDFRIKHVFPNLKCKN